MKFWLTLSLLLKTKEGISLNRVKTRALRAAAQGLPPAGGGGLEGGMGPWEGNLASDICPVSYQRGLHSTSKRTARGVQCLDPPITVVEVRSVRLSCILCLCMMAVTCRGLLDLDGSLEPTP